MKMNPKIYGLFIFFIFSITSLFAQNVPLLEQKLKMANIEMYENPDKVIKLGFEVLALAADDIDLKIKAIKLISDGYSSKRDYQKSLKYVLKAIELLPKSSNKLLKIAIATKAGIQYHQLKIYQKAITYLDDAETLCMDFPEKDSIKSFLGVNYIVRGLIYKEKLNCDIAISFFDKGISEIMAANKPLENASRISIAKYNKGNCFMLLAQNEEAISSFNDALNVAKTVKASSLQAFAQKGIAQVYTLKGNYKQAIFLLNQAYLNAQNVNDLVLNQEIYKGLAENYLALNNLEYYYQFQRKYTNTQTQVKKNERASLSNLLQENLNSMENEAKFENSKFWFLLLFICSLFVLVFTFFSIKNLKTEIANLKAKTKDFYPS